MIPFLDFDSMSNLSQRHTMVLFILYPLVCGLKSILYVLMTQYQKQGCRSQTIQGGSPYKKLTPEMDVG